MTSAMNWTLQRGSLTGSRVFELSVVLFCLVFFFFTDLTDVVNKGRLIVVAMSLWLF